MSQPAAAKPLLTITAGKGWAPIDLGEVWMFRDLLVTLAIRDIKLRYRQTLLGVGWVVVQPLLSAGAVTLLFGLIAGLKAGEGIPYFVFSFASFLAWTLFSQTLSKTSGSLVGNASLVSKVYFPRLILPLSTVATTLLDLAVAFGMLAILLVTFGIVPGWQLVLLPIWIAIILTMSLGLGLISAALVVTYRDVGLMVPLATQLFMYASAVMHPLSAVDPNNAKLMWVFRLNPIVPVMEGFRWSVLNMTPVVEPWQYAYSAIVAVVCFVVGAYSFKRMERKFADVI